MTYRLLREGQPPFYPFYAGTPEQARAAAELLDWKVLGVEGGYVLVA